MCGKGSDDQFLHEHAAKPHADKDHVATSRPVRYVEGVSAVDKEAQRKANRHARNVCGKRIYAGRRRKGEKHEHVNSRADTPKECVRDELSERLAHGTAGVTCRVPPRRGA